MGHRHFKDSFLFQDSYNVLPLACFLRLFLSHPEDWSLLVLLSRTVISTDVELYAFIQQLALTNE